MSQQPRTIGRPKGAKTRDISQMSPEEAERVKRTRALGLARVMRCKEKQKQKAAREAAALEGETGAQQTPGGSVEGAEEEGPRSNTAKRPRLDAPSPPAELALMFPAPPPTAGPSQWRVPRAPMVQPSYPVSGYASLAQVGLSAPYRFGGSAPGTTTFGDYPWSALSMSGPHPQAVPAMDFAPPRPSPPGSLPAEPSSLQSAPMDVSYEMPAVEHTAYSALQTPREEFAPEQSLSVPTRDAHAHPGVALEQSRSVSARNAYTHQLVQTEDVVGVVPTPSSVTVHAENQTDAIPIPPRVSGSTQTDLKEYNDWGTQADGIVTPEGPIVTPEGPIVTTEEGPIVTTEEGPIVTTEEPLVTAADDETEKTKHPPADLESILKEQFSDEEATIRWQNGVLTVAPMCRDKDGNNTLQHDLKFVRMLAKYALPAAQCPWITAIEYNADMSDQELGQRIREALRCGNAVLITGYPRKHRMDRFQMTLAGVCEHFKLKPRATYTTLDAAIRTRVALPSEDEDDDSTPPPEDDNAPKPYHIPMTLAEFMDKMNSGRFVRCILDAPSVEDLSVGFISDIDDGITEWYRSRHPNRISQPCDVHESRSWLLFHYGMFHTYPHYDSEGFCTLIRIEKGQKEWVLMRGSGLDKCRTRKQHDKAMRSVGCTDVQFRKDVELYVASVTDGDILIQGPGQTHQVYTPVPTASSGSHFYMIDTMHLTEAVMRYDLSVEHSDTNHGHISAQLTLHLMINAIKDNDRRYYPRKALAALCRMLINPKDYFDQRPEYNRPDTDLAYWRQEYAGKDGVPGMRKRIPKMPDVQQALSNARTLVASLNLDTEMDNTLKKPHETPSFNDYIFRGGFLDPGEDVDIEPVKHLLKSAKMLAPIADDDLAEDVDAYETEVEDVEDEDYVEPRKKSRKSREKKATGTKGKGRTRR